MGSRPRAQPLEVAHTLHTLIDTVSRATIAQAEVHECYDSLDLLRFLHWFRVSRTDCAFLFESDFLFPNGLAVSHPP